MDFKSLDDVRQFIMDDDLSLEEARSCIEQAVKASRPVQNEIIALGVETFIARIAYLWRRQPNLRTVETTPVHDAEPARGRPKISNSPPKERGWMERYTIFGAAGYRIAIGEATKGDLRAAIRHGNGIIAGTQKNVAFYSELLTVMHNAKKANDQTRVNAIISERAFRKMAEEAGLALETADVA